MIAAACSHYNLLTQEAILREKKALTTAPANPQKADKIRQLEQSASRFIYHAEKDLYLCPANDKLRLVRTVKPSEKSRGHRVYTGANCANCLKKEKWTQAKKGRKIKRYREDEARDKLRSPMTKPESKRILSQRKVMVEPVFSALRGIQGLERFRRRGLSAVRVEFTLHAIAYNLSRAVALILWAIFSLSGLSVPITGDKSLWVYCQCWPFATPSHWTRVYGGFC
ncbi:transposase [Photorhabdus sp. RM157S]|uniref:Transposase DDE domain-containing protein n=1 Tax=Photorhabdus thracensis TaxID=230089 RepID=A0A0F7LQC7_9GAMM|nr:hypothetical protein VY86_13760 [Photorhabdus thracensis]